MSSVDWILLCLCFTDIKHLAFSSTPFAGTALRKSFFPKISDILKWLPCSRLEKIEQLLTMLGTKQISPLFGELIIKSRV